MTDFKLYLTIFGYGYLVIVAFMALVVGVLYFLDALLKKSKMRQN